MMEDEGFFTSIKNGVVSGVSWVWSIATWPFTFACKFNYYTYYTQTQTRRHMSLPETNLYDLTISPYFVFNELACRQ